MLWAMRFIWHPVWFWIGAGVVSAPALYTLLREVVYRRTTVLEFGLGVAVILGAWAAIQALWEQPAGLVMAGYLVIAGAYIVVMCNRIASLSDRPMVERELRRAQAAAQRDPTNAAARAYLGELCLRLGRPEEAVEHLGEAVRIAPLPHYGSMLKEANEAVRASREGQVRCRVCGALNPVSNMLCSQCGATVAGFGFLAERVGLTYLGKPRWAAGLVFVPVTALALLVGKLHPMVAVGVTGAMSVAFVVQANRLISGQQ